MYLKSIALFVAIYGRGVLAALPPSCQEGDTGACATGDKCTPKNAETEPPQTGEVWYSACCTESETDNTATPPTTSKEYCYSWKLKDVSSNLLYGIKPACSKSASSNVAWDLYGQCSTSGVSCSSSIYLLCIVPFISTLILTHHMSLRLRINYRPSLSYSLSLSILLSLSLSLFELSDY